MTRAECFVDTNTLIHYKPADQIDWLSLTNASEVVVTVCVTVIHELDDKKTSGRTVRLRKRAQDALRRLTAWAEQGEQPTIREHVTLRLIADEPSAAWATLGLDSQVPDDRIIAAVLGQRLGPDVPVSLVTADLAPRLKARARSVSVITLPDEYLQPDVMGEQDQEEGRLRQRLAVLEGREPKLSLQLVTTAGRAVRRHYVLALLTPPSESEGDVEQLVEEERRLLLAELAPFAGTRGVILDPADVKRFKDAIPPYLAEYRAHFEDKRAHDTQVALTLEVACVLANTGYAPGEGVHVALHVPDGPAVYNQKTLPKAPRPPRRPTRPLTGIEKITSGLDQLMQKPFDIVSVSSGLLGESAGPRIKKTNSYVVEYDFPEVQHGFEVPMDPIYCVFANPDAVKSFSITYVIRAKNLPLPTEGQLDIIVELGSGPPSP